MLLDVEGTGIEMDFHAAQPLGQSPSANGSDECGKLANRKGDEEEHERNDRRSWLPEVEEDIACATDKRKNETNQPHAHRHAWHCRIVQVGHGAANFGEGAILLVL